MSQLLKISSAFAPPPPEGFVSPMTWGVQSNVIERFGQAGVPREGISMQRKVYRFQSSDVGPRQFIELYRQFYGTTMNAFEAAGKDGKVEALQDQLVALATFQNQGGPDRIAIDATYLLASVTL